MPHVSLASCRSRRPDSCKLPRYGRSCSDGGRTAVLGRYYSCTGGAAAAVVVVAATWESTEQPQATGHRGGAMRGDWHNIAMALMAGEA